MVSKMASPVYHNFSMDGIPVEPVNDSSTPVQDEVGEMEMNPPYAGLRPLAMGMGFETPVTVIATATATATGTATANATATATTTGTATANAQAKVAGAEKNVTATATATTGAASKRKMPPDENCSNWFNRGFKRVKRVFQKKVHADQKDEEKDEEQAD